MRLAVLSFLDEPKGRQVLLHKDNTAVVQAINSLTSRSIRMMAELTETWRLLDENRILPQAR